MRLHLTNFLQMQKTIKLAKYMNGKIIHVDDAINGLACNCVCLVCKERLQAVHPRFKQTHFRHNQNLDCTGGPETALHLFAKQIILANEEINIPGSRLKYTNPKAENCLGKITPDVTIQVDEQPIYFEIAVTHKIGDEKLNFYRVNEMKAIEIDLTGISYDFKKPEIERIVLEKVSNKIIIFWEKILIRETNTESQNDKIFWAIAIISALLVIPRCYLYIRKKLRL